MNPIFTETYKVRSTQVNLNNQLGLYGVLGMLQDIAAEHADALGFGYKELVKKGFFWALIQQKLKMEAMTLLSSILVPKEDSASRPNAYSSPKRCS